MPRANEYVAQASAIPMPVKMASVDSVFVSVVDGYGNSGSYLNVNAKTWYTGSAMAVSVHNSHGTFAAGAVVPVSITIIGMAA